MMKIFIIWILGISSVLANEFTKANNLFTVAAYKQVLKQSHGNFLVSPFSAETILALTQSGCKGKTAEEIRNVLHLPNDKAKIENEVKNLLAELKKDYNDTLYIANKMYVKGGYPIKAEFQKAASEIYGAESENIDFSQNEEAASVMNAWIEEKTNNKIHDLIDPQSLSDDTRLVLINALYFKGAWSIPFLVSNTKKSKFYKTAEDYVEVDTMYKPADHAIVYNYYECPYLHAQLIELPYRGTDASMTVILPMQKDGIAKLENQLDRVFSTVNFKEAIVNLSLPKFKIESKIDFLKILQNLGVKKAFDEIFADLSDISGKKGDLIIDEIIQKTFIDVSENGVEAAAATYVKIYEWLGPGPHYHAKYNFIADHPFIFYIKVKGIILFAGKVTDPTR